MKNISGKTLIFYTFQDSAAKNIQYNVTTFKKSAPNQVKIRDVLFELPLNYEANSYHFRFKSQFFEADDKVVGWIDISNLLAKVPMIGNSIFVKILKIEDDRHNKLFCRDKLRAVGLIDPKAPKTNPPSKQTSVNGEKKRQENFLEEVHLEQAPKTEPKNGTKPDITVEKSKKEELFEFPAQKTPPIETPAQRLEGFKKACEQQELDRQNERVASRQLQQKLREWGYSGHKTINNLTTMLATLHTIWPEWKPVSLADMMKPEDVQALLKKAVVRVHPDKNRNKDFRTKYLAKRVFELLNDAKIAQQSSS